MKSFQQSLLLAATLGLAVLCLFQGYVGRAQRSQIRTLQETLHDKSAMLQDYTNSVRTMDEQMSAIDARVMALKAAAQTNATLLASRTLELSRLQATAAGLTNQAAEYQATISNLQTRLQDAHRSLQQQADLLKDLATQRDELVRKFNASLQERTDLVSKCNQLVEQMEKLQGSKP